ncbi:MAG: hypothetical protein HY300_08975 [Verrucomicrobia bacterium]|nr:hypothetical protein [Verrucomicrobiota bacterium]
MSMAVNKARLAAVTKELSARWDETKEQWRDAKCDEFQHKYMDELFASVDTSLGVIEQLDKLAAKIRSDCE